MSLRFLLLTAVSASPTVGFALQSSASASRLELSGNGTFQISVFEDLHYGEAEDADWGPQQDVNSTRVMNAVLDAEAQQLVVLNGDLITGENTFLENSTHYVDEIVQPLVARGLQWASTYGNHDSDVNISRAGIYEREKRYAGSLTGNMVNTSTAGVSNYYLPVFDGDSTATPAFILWFFDSRGGNYFQETEANGDAVPQPDWVDQSVVDWFNATKTSLENEYLTYIPSIAFVHIPISAMLAIQDQGVNANYEPGINDDVPLDAQGDTAGQGTASGGFTYAQQDYPFMEELLATKGLMAVFSGHDHGDTWCYNWNSTLPGMNLTGNGLDLCFGQHSGYGGYGSWIRGSRQILLQAGKQEVQTWIRLEDGSESGRVTLNATYGQDWYPAVEDRNSYGGTI